MVVNQRQAVVWRVGEEDHSRAFCFVSGLAKPKTTIARVRSSRNSGVYRPSRGRRCVTGERLSFHLRGRRTRTRPKGELVQTSGHPKGGGEAREPLNAVWDNH